MLRQITRRVTLAILLLAISGSAQATKVLRIAENTDAGLLEPAEADPTTAPFVIPLTVVARLTDLGANQVEIRVWRQEEFITDAAPTLVLSNQPCNSDENGAYRQVVKLTGVETSLEVALDELDLPQGHHTLLFEASTTDRSGRSSRVYSDPIMVFVEQQASVRSVRTEERQVERIDLEERTRIVRRRDPNIPPTAHRPTMIEVEESYVVEVPRIDAQQIEVATIEPGAYGRVYAEPALGVAELDLSDPNVRAELERLQNLSKVDRERSRTIYYATNRKVVDPGATDTGRFGNQLGASVSYGSASVRIPPTHRYGDEIEAPYFSFFDDPEKHFRVTSLNELSENDFYTVMRNTLIQADDGAALTRNDILLYVHGFNTSMKFALLRPAQISYDIGFEGKTCAFVWPSTGLPIFSYTSDQNKARESIPMLKDVLTRLIAERSDGRVHIVAHSMGNYLTLQALVGLANDFSAVDASERPQLGHVVLAAPDVWERDFLVWTPRAIQIAKSVTLYHCSDDKPLQISVIKNPNEPRAGLSRWPLRGLDCVDCDEVNTEFLGHSAYADESPLLFDLQLLLQRDARPHRRPLTRLEEFEPGYPYWQARADLAPVLEDN